MNPRINYTINIPIEDREIYISDKMQVICRNEYINLLVKKNILTRIV